MTMNSSNSFNSKKISVIITAAGSSSRMGGSIKKEYLPYKNGTVISSCAIAFLKAAEKNKWNLSHFVVTYPCGGLKESQKAVLIPDVKSQAFKDISFVEGGDSRQASVFKALDFINQNGKSDIVLIHDGARPFVSESLIQAVVDSVLKTGDGAVPGLTPVETIKEIDSEGRIVKHLKRITLSSVQTPQGFDFNKLYDFNLKAKNDDYEYTDDTEIYGHFGGTVRVVPADPDNIKITYPKDLERIKK